MNIRFQKTLLLVSKSALLTFIITYMLYNAGLILVNSADITHILYLFINCVAILFCWLFITLLIYKYSLLKVLLVIGFLIISILAEHFINEPFNPITIPSLLLFWLGVVYLIVPEFFKKYSIFIFSVYGLTLVYFFIFRLKTNYAEAYHQNFLNFILIPTPLFIALWFYEQWRWLKVLKEDKMKAELTSLKNQINPHFFFNTLNNLYGLAIEKSDKTPEVILKLSDMMRYTIYDGKQDLVALSDEINYLKNYIELHKIRYQKNVEISFTHDVGKELKVSPLLFINLLENGFKHGIEKMTANAYLHIKMKSIDKKLYFTIENNYEITIPNRKQGIGLENLKKRLEYLYKNKYELIIEQKTSVYIVHLNLSLI